MPLRFSASGCKINLSSCPLEYRKRNTRIRLFLSSKTTLSVINNVRPRRHRNDKTFSGSSNFSVKSFKPPLPCK